MQKADFIETENGGADDDANFTALWWARQYFKPQTKGSDSHVLSAVGKTGTVFLEDIRTVRGHWRQLKSGKKVGVRPHIKGDKEKLEPSVYVFPKTPPKADKG